MMTLNTNQTELDADLETIIGQINEAANGHPIGSLQEIRTQIKGLLKHHSTLFRFTPERNHPYVFHYGGLSELQFNFGFEPAPDDHIHFRHGVALSFQRTRSEPDISKVMARVPKFNDYLRENGEEFADLEMWHWAGRNQPRSLNYPPTPIPGRLMNEGAFIFLGRSYERDSFNIDRLLSDFDCLLPLYIHIETDVEASQQSSPKEGENPINFSARPPPRVMWTTASHEARMVDIQLRHTAIQQTLYDRLVATYGKAQVGAENLVRAGGRIDLAVRMGSTFAIYEIKTSSTARGCIREALGQIMDYAFWPSPPFVSALYVAGEPPLTSDTKHYLERLNTNLPVPLQYVQVKPGD